MQKFAQLLNDIKHPHYAKQNINMSDFANMGLSLMNQTENIAEKEYIVSNLIDLMPNEPAFYYYMGFINKINNPEKALENFRISYKLNPNNVENLIELCNILLHKDKKDEMLALNVNNLFDKYTDDWRFASLYYDCMHHISNTTSLKHLKMVIYQLQLKTNKTEAEKKLLVDNICNISQLYGALCNHEMAVSSAEQAIIVAELCNANPATRANAITCHMFTSNYVYGVDSREHYADLNNYCKKTPKFAYNMPPEKRSKKINIGYISSDFVEHAVSNFILPILENHSDKFNVFIFNNSQKNNPIISNLNATFYDIKEIDDEKVAALINKLSISILFDLNGNTTNNRMGIFSYRPAPIAISYIGYPNTTGFDFINYRITDDVADHPDSTQYFKEKKITLPNCFLLYKNYYQKTEIRSHTTNPQKIVLGAINKETKTNAAVLSVWKTILKHLPNTVIMIKLESSHDTANRLAFYMAELEVDKTRIIAVDQMSTDAYFRLFSQIDIMLDTFPYCGTTTTCNALYNSIPLITMYNKDIHAHNVSSSILTNAGLPEFVAHSQDEYIKKVKELCENVEQLNRYKTEIHDKFVESMNAEKFMANYEKTLIELYETAPVSIIEPDKRVIETIEPKHTPIYPTNHIFSKTEPVDYVSVKPKTEPIYPTNHIHNQHQTEIRFNPLHKQ